MDFVYQIDNLLTPDECQKYMNMFKEKDLIENIDDNHRKYYRIQFDDKEIANKLYQKIKNNLSKKIKK